VASTEGRIHCGTYALGNRFLMPQNQNEIHQVAWPPLSGVFSHATALTLHDLSDVVPAKLDMTVLPDSGGWRQFPLFYACGTRGCMTETCRRWTACV
jgi:hypothetical protein